MSDLGDQINNLSPARRALLKQKLASKRRRRGPGPAPPQAGRPRVLSCAQQQMWFVDQLTPGIAAYNVPYAVHLHGRSDMAALQKALNAIVGRHEVLRTMYLPYQGKVIPAVAKKWAVELRQVDLRDQAISDDALQVLPAGCRRTAPGPSIWRAISSFAPRSIG